MPKYYVEYNIVVTATLEAEDRQKAFDIAGRTDLRAFLNGELPEGMEEDQYVPELAELSQIVPDEELPFDDIETKKENGYESIN